jgi:anti-sigma factor RsiW
MSKEDTDCVKYILEEMDPAEKIEFERKMASNPDLRIEVESIRRMNSKIRELPDFTPPKELTNSILAIAEEQANQRQGGRKGYFLSAAVVILGLTTGSLLLQNNIEFTGSSSNAAAGFQSAGNQLIQSSDRSPAGVDLQPWIDRQNVLRLSGFESGSELFIQKEAARSFEKLRPVGRYPDFQPLNRSVQLTNSNR